MEDDTQQSATLVYGSHGMLVDFVSCRLRHSMLVFILLLIGSPGWARAELLPPIMLAPGVPIIMDDTEPESIQRAVVNLQRDLEKVLGKKSPLARPSKLYEPPAIVVTCQGDSTEGYRIALEGDEAHAIRVVDSRVVIQGSDARGTIYAIYEFADRFLGVSPIWAFGEIEPSKQQMVRVPADTDLRFDAPAIRWRTWFPNDNRMLDAWLDRSPEHLDLMLETLLRLKFNCLDVDHLFDVPEPNQGLRWARACRDRGITVATTHIAPLGIRWQHWETYWTKVRGKEKAPPLTLANKELFDDFWRYPVELAVREKLPMRYGIVFRGEGDKYLSHTFPDAPGYNSYETQAKIVGPMLKRQLELLCEVTGRDDLDTRIVLYEETMRQVAKGELELPQADNMVWTYGNENRSSVPYLTPMRNGAKRCDAIGFYWNMQYTSIGAHHAQGQGPWKLQKILQRIEKDTGKPLAELQINVGNVREFLFTLSSASEMAWQGAEGFDVDTWAMRWCKRHFGEAVGNDTVQAYRQLVDIYWHVRGGELFQGDARSQDSRWLDLKTARTIEAGLAMLESGRYEPNPLSNYHSGEMSLRDLKADSQVHAILQYTEAMLTRLTKLEGQTRDLLGRVDPAGQKLFAVSLHEQVCFLRHANTAMLHVLHAAGAMDSGNKKLLAESLDAARTELETVRDVFSRQDANSRFDGWHQAINKHSYRANEYLEQLSIIKRNNKSK